MNTTSLKDKEDILALTQKVRTERDFQLANALSMYKVCDYATAYRNGVRAYASPAGMNVTDRYKLHLKDKLQVNPARLKPQAVQDFISLERGA